MINKIDNQDLNKDLFYRIILDINQSSIESYYALSTVLVVVYGIQKNQKNIFNLLKPINFLVSAYENLIELHNIYIKIENNEFSPMSAIKLTKYLYRTLISIKYTKIHHDFKNFDRATIYCERILNQKNNSLSTFEFVFLRKHFFTDDFNSPNSILLKLYLWLNNQKKKFTSFLYKNG